MTNLDIPWSMAFAPDGRLFVTERPGRVRIVSFAARTSELALVLEDAALYQALYRLEKRGLVTADWGVTEQNRRARFYRITPAGRASLTKQTNDWLRYADVMTEILTASPRRT